MDSQSAISIMRKDGYCLWIGSGVSRYLSKGKTPDWNQLVNVLEKEANCINNEFNMSNSERLEIVLKTIGRNRFQILLRKKLLSDLAIALIDSVKKIEDTNELIPEEVRQLSKLGMLANPIVNFNVETITSHIISATGGPYSIKCFNPPMPESINQKVDAGSISDSIYHRHVYHPHGAIDLYGICIITESEYKSLSGSLAYELAVHSAFMTTLVIVGMSLEDHYLRDQLTSFRNQINTIIWFRSSPPRKDIQKWALINSVDIVLMDTWNSFWNGLVNQFPSPNELSLTVSWSHLISTLFSSSSTSGIISQFIDMFKDMKIPDLLLAREYLHASNCGEIVKDDINEKLDQPMKDIIIKRLLMRINEIS